MDQTSSDAEFSLSARARGDPAAADSRPCSACPTGSRGCRRRRSADHAGRGPTVKKCPPFIDAMTYGFLIPLAGRPRGRDGEFSWELECRPGRSANYSRSPIDFHDASQVAGTPFFDDDRFIIKFNNFWTIELPPGYSLLVTHPVNRARPAVHDADRPGRCRPLLRQLRPFSGALARSRLQRRACRRARRWRNACRSGGKAGPTGSTRSPPRIPSR